MPVGLGREHWANAAPVRRIFKEAFERVGLPYVKPHTIRDTLTQFGYSLKLTAEELKAWSQNMGHDSALMTIKNYAPMTVERQAEIIGGLKHRQPGSLPDEAMASRIAEMVASKLKNNEMAQT